MVLKIFRLQISTCIVQYFLSYIQYQIPARYRSRTNAIGIISGRQKTFKSKSIPNHLMFLVSCLTDLVKEIQIQEILPTGTNTHREHLWDVAQLHCRRTSSLLRSQQHFFSPWIYFAENSCEQQTPLEKKISECCSGLQSGSMLHRTLSSWVLSPSREVPSTCSLANLFSCSNNKKYIYESN